MTTKTLEKCTIVIGNFFIKTLFVVAPGDEK